MDYRCNRPVGERRHGHPSFAQPSVVCDSHGRRGCSGVRRPRDQPGRSAKATAPDRVREAIRTRDYSRRTEKAYVAWIRRYIFFHGKRHPADMGAAEITRFLTSLAVDGKVAASTQNQALSALLFLYREVLQQEVPRVDDRSMRRTRPTILERKPRRTEGHHRRPRTLLRHRVERSKPHPRR